MKHITEILPSPVRSAKNVNSKAAEVVVLAVDPVVPPTNMARVKLDIRGQSDTTVINMATGHLNAMTDNPVFPDPSPTQGLFAAALVDFSAQKVVADAAVAAAAQAMATKAASRTVLTNLYTLQGAFVDTVAGGVAANILSAAMQVRSAGTSVGDLSPPINLALTLNGTPGVMVLTWNSVAGSRSYLVQSSPADTAVRVWSHATTVPTATATLTNMPIGQMMAFRVAAVGGTSGESPWCVEVTRMAA